MTIASEIQRLQTAKADIRTAIQSKDVSVPASATLDEYNEYINQIVSGGYAVGGIMSGTNIITGQRGGSYYGGSVATYMSVIQKNGNLFGVAAGRHHTSSSNSGVCYGAFGKRPNEAFYGGSDALVTSSVDPYLATAWWQNSNDLSKLKLRLIYRWSGSGTNWTQYYNYMDIDIDAGTITVGDAGTITYSGDNNPLPANWVSVDPANIQGYTNGWATNVTASVIGRDNDYYLNFTLA